MWRYRNIYADKDGMLSSGSECKSLSECRMKAEPGVIAHGMYQSYAAERTYRIMGLKDYIWEWFRG